MNIQIVLIIQNNFNYSMQCEHQLPGEHSYLTSVCFVISDQNPKYEL